MAGIWKGHMCVGPFNFIFPLVLHGVVMVLLYLKKTCLQGSPWYGNCGKMKGGGNVSECQMLLRGGVR